MKTVILAGTDNLAFLAADLLNPAQLKLIGFATPIEEAWNIYDENGNVKEIMEEMPAMPLETAVGMEPELLILAAGTRDEEEQLKYAVLRTGYQGEVLSLFDYQRQFSAKTAVLRRLAWRLQELGVEGAAADLGAGYGDISWQLNALMPKRQLYLFESFRGYDARDVKMEQELGLSDARAGQYAFSPREQQQAEELLLARMPYPEQVRIKAGWFPETAFELEDQTYALVYMDAGLYAPTFSGIQYFFPRLSKGGVIVLSGYENGKNRSVKQAVADLEQQYGTFLITPLCDLDGTVVIMRP